MFGVSADSVADQKAFAEKFDFPYPLLADNNKDMCRAYGVLGLLPYPSRHSFLIDPTGKIVKIYKKVKPDSHAGDVLKDLDELT